MFHVKLFHNINIMPINDPQNNYLLKKYIDILILWQSKINLISNNSINNIWGRHVNDSLQIKEYITKTNKHIVDIGSGAGFPGMVLAIIDNNNNYTLIESNSKKAIFLNYVKVNLKLKNVNIINDRIENLTSKLTCDYLISRGLTNLEKLLLYCKGFLSHNSLGIFLKGENFYKELNKLQNNQLFNLFNIENINNKINNKGKIILVKRKLIY